MPLTFEVLLSHLWFSLHLDFCVVSRNKLNKPISINLVDFGTVTRSYTVAVVRIVVRLGFYYCKISDKRSFATRSAVHKIR